MITKGSSAEDIKKDLQIGFSTYQLDEETKKYLESIPYKITQEILREIMINTQVFLTGSMAVNNTAILFYEYDEESIEFSFAIKEE